MFSSVRSCAPIGRAAHHVARQSRAFQEPVRKKKNKTNPRELQQQRVDSIEKRALLSPPGERTRGPTTHNTYAWAFFKRLGAFFDPGTCTPSGGSSGCGRRRRRISRGANTVGRLLLCTEPQLGWGRGRTEAILSCGLRRKRDLIVPRSITAQLTRLETLFTRRWCCRAQIKPSWLLTRNVKHHSAVHLS